MKKLFLLLLTGSIASGASAQYRQMGLMSVQGNVPSHKVKFSKADLPGNSSGAAHKTTAGGDRYYNYAWDYIDTLAKVTTGGAEGAGNIGVLMWNDTNMIYQFTGTTPGSRHINLTSIGEIFDPNAASFNDSTYFTGLMKVTTSNAYVVDSVVIAGQYNFNPAKTSIVDTIRLSFVKGHGGSETSDDIFSGGGTSGGHYGTISFHDMHYDSVLNYARHGMTWGTPSDNVKDIIITNANWGDTNVNGIMTHRVALPTPLSVTAGGFAGMSITFISGDPARSTSPTAPSGGDTVLRANGSAKFNFYTPLVTSQQDLTSGDLKFPPFITGDHNTGYFKSQPSWENGWSETYVPQYAWSTSGGTGASDYQYPFVTWHVTCSTCGVITNTVDPGAVKSVSTINTVNAYPNPANSEVSVPFTLSQNANVTVSLSNMLGQVVATQNINNVTSGNAVFNTSALSAGVYMYTIIANNEHSTGRVTIAH